MPRYFMHLRDGDATIEDPEGSERDTLEDALKEAMLDARDLMAADMKQGFMREGAAIEIVEGGTVRGTVNFRDAYVKR